MSVVSISVNKKDQTIASSTSLQQLLEELNISPTGIAAAVNDQVIIKSSWTTTILQKGDKVTIIQATQGG